LPVNLLLAGAAVACLEYPVFCLREIEIAFADGRDVPPELYQKVRAAITAAADSNLFSLDENKIAKSVLEQNDNLVRVDARLVLPDKLRIRMHPAKPMLWWSERRVLSLAGDGRLVPVAATDCFSGFPIGAGHGAPNETITRWRMLEFYQALVEHNPRWAEVISQIENDPTAGWLLVLNGGAERIIFGRYPDTETFDRVVRFLETVPEDEWARATIDARFGGKVIVTSSTTKGRGSRKTSRENSSLPAGGRS
jgi:hypothetical protein